MLKPRFVGALIGATVATVLLAGCSSDSGAEAQPDDNAESATDSDDNASQPRIPAVSNSRGERVRTLGQNGVVLSPQRPLDRLGNGLVPLPDAPLFEGDYADPFVLADGTSLYLFTTNTVDQNVPVLRSGAGIVGVPLGDALPELPSWTEPGFVWAPSVLATDDGYVMYYSSRDVESDLQCVGVAFSEAPEGPYVDRNDEPFVCQRDLGGTIDASPVRDEDGQAWLLYKNDGNCCDILTEIWAQQLTEDGMGLLGEPVSLLQTSEPWEGPLIEGPTMTRAGDTYWLFYSSNWWDSPDYTVGVARCESVTGPCTKVELPWLESHGTAVGPGGPEEFVDAVGNQWVVYHAWDDDAVGYHNGGSRSLFALPLDLSGDAPVTPGLTSE